MKIQAFHICHDVDDQDDEALPDLPETLTFNIDPEHFEGEEEIEQWLSDAISARTQFCHRGFRWEYVD